MIRKITVFLAFIALYGITSTSDYQVAFGQTIKAERKKEIRVCSPE